MQNKIDKDQVKQIAKLARLDLNDKEIAAFSAQLSEILEYVEKLNQLDTDNVEPLAHCLPVNNVFGKDEPKKSLDLEQALKNAPQRENEYFKVPKILDENYS